MDSQPWRHSVLTSYVLVNKAERVKIIHVCHLNRIIYLYLILFSMGWNYFETFNYRKIVDFKF